MRPEVMAQDGEVNPYEPPASSEVPEPPEPETEDLSVSALPGAVWEKTKLVFNRARTAGIVGFVAFIQLLNQLVANTPNLMMGRTSVNPFDPQANAGNAEVFTGMGAELAIGFGIAAIVVGLGQLLVVAMTRPLRRLYTDGVSAVPDFSSAFSMAVSRVPVLIVVGILWFMISAVGLIACILPGVILLMLAWFPSYVAVCSNLGIIDSVTGGWEFAKRQWKGFGLVFLIVIGVFGVLSCPLAALQMIPGIGLFLNMAANIAMGTVAVIFYATLMITLEVKDRQEYGAAAWETPNIVSQHGSERTSTSSEPSASSESSRDGSVDGEDDDFVTEW